VTTVARTLFDLAAVLPRHLLERAVNEAEVLKLSSPVSVGALVARYPGHRGTRLLGEIVERGMIGRARTRSDLEARFLAFLDAHGLPRPATNRPLEVGDGGHREPDCVWPERRLVVELDGYETHGTRQAFEDDRARDRALQAAGYRTVRITDRQLDAEPATIARQLASLLMGPPHATRASGESSIRGAVNPRTANLPPRWPRRSSER
jgi:hypothetical protein